MSVLWNFGFNPVVSLPSHKRFTGYKTGLQRLLSHFLCLIKLFISNILGVLAQLVERLNGIEEVRGSNPLGSKSLQGLFLMQRGRERVEE